MSFQCLFCQGEDARTQLAAHFCTGCFVDLSPKEKQSALERWESEEVEGYERRSLARRASLRAWEKEEAA